MKAAPPCPWLQLPPDGAGLQLEQFLSFHLVRLTQALQRHSARAYLEPHGLSAPEWRILGLVHTRQPIRFADVCAWSSIDKAQVSRSVRQLRERGLLAAQEDEGHAQRLLLSLTPAGRRLVARILPQAARLQAGLLAQLPAAQRQGLWQSLHQLADALAPPPIPQAAARGKHANPNPNPNRKTHEQHSG